MLQTRLPLEILRPVFLGACAHRPTIVALLSVCKASHEWVLPVLYRFVTFWQADQISKFYALHNAEELLGRLQYIQHLWIGSTPRCSGDLEYGSTSWPITILDRILNASTNLRSLYIINLSQNQWYRLEDAIPECVETLAMGPVHGPVLINHMKHKPRIRYFTSAQTFMRDDEIQDLVLSPHLRIFRRVMTPSRAWNFSFLDQVACVSKSDALKEMQLVFCGRLTPPIPELEVHLKTTTSDSRVVVSRSQYDNWMEVLHSDFQAGEEAYLASISRPA
ncbi:hypothetical protein FPV67DRAFT_1489718 [Lyophyllum atratum]|nr:hypothetical protein FPV67DRAFT_1489718 [Lyophyllum atratum]